MANEDFTTYSEVDEDEDLTVIASKITCSTMRRDALSYVRDSKGVGHFGDFIHNVKVVWTYVSGSGGIAGFWGLSNNQNTWQQMTDADVGLIASVFQYLTAKYHYLRDCFDDASDFTTLIGYDTLWITVERDGATLTAKLYSDDWGGTLVDTLTLTCQTTTYEHIFGILSQETDDADAAETISLDVEELDLQEVVGWTGKIMGVTNPAKIMGVAVSSISKVMGVS